MRVIFLDIDGVLWTGNHHRHLQNHCDGSYQWGNDFCPKAVGNLNRILNEFLDIRIVISSAWRVLHDYSWLKDHFESQGIDSRRIIGTTPDLFREIRGKEIQEWIDTRVRELGSPIDDFIILDDDEDMGNLTSGHLYRTGFYTGLTDDVTERILRRFRGKTS